MSEVDLKPLSQLLREECPGHYGWQTAETLVRLAKSSVSSRQALQARQNSLRILCDQLEHTQANLVRLEAEIEQLLTNDPGVKGVQQIPEFGSKTVAVLRAELGDMQRFTRTDEVIAYGGMDIEIKESGKWKGKANLSKHGSGLLRRMLSPFSSAQHSPGRLGFRNLLSPPGRAWPQERFGPDGSHAQNAGSGCSLTHAREGGV